MWVSVNSTDKDDWIRDLKVQSPLRQKPISDLVWW